MNDQQPPESSPLTGDEASIPSDRDEKPTAPTENGQHRNNREVIEQGRSDVESGIQDTERYGIPTNVPTSGDD